MASAPRHPSEGEQYNQEIRATVLTLAIQALNRNDTINHTWPPETLATNILTAANMFLLFVTAETPDAHVEPFKNRWPTSPLET